MSEAPEPTPDALLERFRLLNLVAMRRALDHHNSQGCPVPARAIRLHPMDHELLGWNVLWGLPVVPDDTVRVKSVRIDCEGSAHDIERELKAYTDDHDADFG
jgi:hypothetical protein